jgi:hypothetical protein
MSTYSKTAQVWCRVGGSETPFLVVPGKSYLFGGGSALWGCYPQNEIPDDLMWDVCGGGTAVPMTPQEFLAHKEYKLLGNPSNKETQEWVSLLEEAVAMGYGGNVPESTGELRQWMSQWEANGRPCTCGSGWAWAACPEDSSYCG